MNTPQTPAPSSSSRDIARCLGGSAVACLLAALLYAWLPWGAVGHGVDTLAKTIVSGVGQCIGLLCMGIKPLVHGPTTFLVTHSPVGAFLMAFLGLSLCCVFIKMIRAIDAGQLQAGLDRACFGLMMALFVGSIVAMVVADGRRVYLHAGIFSPNTPSLAAPLALLTESPYNDPNDFESHVQDVNARLVQLNRQHFDDRQPGSLLETPALPVRIVDAKNRTVELTGHVNWGTCRALADPAVSFTVRRINGQPIHQRNDILPACTYGWQNEVVVEVSPNDWI